jgi:IclR family mhp operon transcriptional activator
MESTRPIRALLRGLDALTVLNLHDGATVSEVVQEIRLPRTTVYRILETLCDAGFVYRDVTDDRYRLTILVRGLSDGFDDEAWVTQIARPFLYELSGEVVWPVAIATLSGTSMLVRETTDHSSPLAIERYSAGFRVPLLTSATGLAFLAHCPATQRDTLIEILARSNQPTEKLAQSPEALRELLAEIRNRGYATVNRNRPVADDVTISIPVALEDRALAGLTIRYTASALPLPAAVSRFVPKLRECAHKIRKAFAQQQAEARPEDASAAVN